MPKYAPSSYDDYFCLKPPFFLWVVAIYLARAIALPVAMGVGRVAGVSADATQLLQSLISLQTMLPSAIAAAVLYTMYRRVPGASQPVRWIWAHGRMLLVASAIIDLGLSLASLLRQADMAEQLPTGLLTAGLDLCFLIYLLAVRRVRDVFADFPMLLTQR